MIVADPAKAQYEVVLETMGGEKRKTVATPATTVIMKMIRAMFAS